MKKCFALLLGGLALWLLVAWPPLLGFMLASSGYTFANWGLFVIGIVTSAVFATVIIRTPRGKQMSKAGKVDGLDLVK